MSVRAGIVTVAALALTACGAVAQTGQGTGAEVATSVFAGLCEAQADPEPVAGIGTFLDRHHIALHTLAARITAVDRAAGAQVLRAKQAVEAVAEDDATPSAVAGDRLDALVAATAGGLAAIGRPDAQCDRVEGS